MLKKPNGDDEIILSDGGAIRECFFNRLSGDLVEVTAGQSSLYLKWADALPRDMKINLNFMKFVYKGSKWYLEETGEASL